MEVVILAGGRGARALPATAALPKPMLPLAGTPLIEHVMGIYAAQGFDRFVVAVGYRREAIEAHFRALERLWTVRYSFAGEEADTGTRLVEAARTVDGTFLATYADGLSDVDLADVLERHREAGRAATVTTVPLRSPYGTVDVGPDGAVTRFTEKPLFEDVWMSGGFFVFEQRALDGLSGTSLERDMLPELAARGELSAYRHRGFWRSVDTFKDLEEIEREMATGRARWAGLTVSGSS